MSEVLTDPDLILTLRLAYRHYGAPTTTEAERDSLLRTIVRRLPGPEGEAAARALFHREKATAQQLTLRALLDGNMPSSDDPTNGS